MFTNIGGIPIDIISLAVGVFSLLNLNSLFDGGDKMDANALISKVKNGTHEVNL